MKFLVLTLPLVLLAGCAEVESSLPKVEDALKRAQASSETLEQARKGLEAAYGLLCVDQKVDEVLCGKLRVILDGVESGTVEGQKAIDEALKLFPH